MRVTVLGCSGSVGGPNSPASGYLLTAPGVEPTVIDFGPGILGALQRYADPSRVTVLLSHLHADHCLDVPGLLVWRRYHPIPATGRARVFGPADTAFRLGVASAECGGSIDDVSDTLDLHRWRDGDTVDFGSYTVQVRQVFHPPESYGMRVTSTEGNVLAYTGDTGMCDAVIDLARDAGIPVQERPFTPDEAKAATEAFISSATNFVLPVVRIDDAAIGDGKPGPVTLRLRAAYLESRLATAI